MKKILLFLFLLPCFLQAQTWTNIYGRFDYEYIRGSKSFRPTIDTVTTAETGSLAYKNDVWYGKKADGHYYNLGSATLDAVLGAGDTGYIKDIVLTWDTRIASYSAGFARRFLQIHPDSLTGFFGVGDVDGNGTELQMFTSARLVNVRADSGLQIVGVGNSKYSIIQTQAGQTLTTQRLKLPNTGNLVDTFATKFDVRAGGGGNLDVTLGLGGALSTNRTSNLGSFKWNISNGSIHFIDTATINHEMTPGTTGYIFERAYPENYNGSQRSFFMRWIESADDNNEPRHDVVGSFWAYNMGPGSSRLTTNEPGFAFKTETYYRADGTSLMEFHLPEFVDSFANYHRLFSMYTHRPTGLTYLQSQISSMSFRHYWDNSGTTDYFSVFSGDVDASHTPGATSMILSSQLAGTGQQVLFTLFDGDGYNYKIQGVSGAFNIFGGVDMTLTPARFLNVPNNVNFGSSDYYSSHDVYFQTSNTTVGKGYYFFQAGQANVMLVLKNGQNESWQPTVNVFETRLDGRVTFGTGTFAGGSGAMAIFTASGAAYPQIHFNPAGVTITSPVNGDLWAITGALWYQDGGASFNIIHPGIKATATLNFGSTAAGAATDLTITLTGAAVGDPVILGVDNASTLTDGSFTAWVSATNTVTVRFTNNNLTTALDPASGSFKVTIIK